MGNVLLHITLHIIHIACSLDNVSSSLKDILQSSPKAGQSPLAHEEIVSISIMEVLIICFVVAGLSFATKMKWDTQTKLIIITGAFHS